MIKSKFFKNVIPSMFAFAFSGIYVIIDGIFVGRNTGDIGLAAVNIIYPISAFMQALGTGIGMAGGILISIRRGQKRSDREPFILGNSIFLLVLSSIVLMLLLLLTYPFVLNLLGAKNELLEPSKNYLSIIIYGTIFQVLATGFIPLVRNYNGALKSMFAMVLGLFANTVLDYLFIVVYPWGTAGAAAATVLGQAITFFYLLPFFFSSKVTLDFHHLKPKAIVLKHIFRLMRSPFGLTFIPEAIVIILNKSSLYHGGIIAVSAYAVISYVMSIIQLLLQGIGDGAQPLVSIYYGAKNRPALRKTRRMSYALSMVVGLGFCFALYFTKTLIPVWFGSSTQGIELYGTALIYFLIGIVFVSILRPSISYLYAIAQHRYASILIYGEPVMLLIFIIIFSYFLNLDGVWLAVPVSQFIMMLLSVHFVNKQLNKVAAIQVTNPK